MADTTALTSTHPRAPAGGFRAWWSHARVSALWMIGIAFVLRAGYILLFHTYQFKPGQDHFNFGWEMGRVGRALAAGEGFSSPFGDHTGPTAWEPPLYPFIIAGVFKLFGIYSSASAIVLLLINSLFSALTCIPIFLIGKRCFGEKVAVWSAWLWALFPYFMFWATRWVWETSLSALLLSTALWLSLTLEDKHGLKPWLIFGLLWGVAALSSPVLLAFLPASGLWAWYRRAKLGKPSLAGVVFASLVFLACVTPWIVRDYQTFGQFIFIRDNFGAELRLGNGDGAEGTCMCFQHPTQRAEAMEQYRQMGELAYVEMRKREAVEWIRQDWWRFAKLTVRRFFYFWGGVRWPALTKNHFFLASSILMFCGLGLALRRHKPGAWLFFWLILLYPMTYYFVYAFTRYRHPIEPAGLLLIVYLVSEAKSRL